MDTCVSAICAFISNASSSSYLHFPYLSDHAWNSCLSCSECELDAKRSIGYMALYSFLEVALVSAAAKQQHPVPDLEPLREAILSDHFLALVLITAGVSDSCSAREYGQVSRAFVVFVEMVILDKGLPEFVVWFADVFNPIISVAFEAFRPVSETPSKHSLASYDYSHCSASKRRRTGSDVSGTRSSTSTLDTLRRLRQRQVLSVSCSSTASLRVILDTQTTTGTDTQSYQTTVKQEFLKAPTMSPSSSAKPCTCSSLSSASLGASNEMKSTQITQTSSTKMLLLEVPCSQLETTVSATSTHGATSSSSPDPLLSAAPAPIIQQRSIVTNTEGPNVQLSSILGTDKACPTDTSTAQPIPATANNLHEAAVLFIEETINMHIKNTIDNVAHGQQTIESTIEKVTCHEQTIENTIDKVISHEQATVNAVERVASSSPPFGATLEVQKRQGSALIGGNGKVIFGNKKWQRKDNHARPPEKQSNVPFLRQPRYRNLVWSGVRKTPTSLSTSTMNIPTAGHI